jgi:hypothetical protein
MALAAAIAPKTLALNLSLPSGYRTNFAFGLGAQQIEIARSLPAAARLRDTTHSGPRHPLVCSRDDASDPSCRRPLAQLRDQGRPIDDHGDSPFSSHTTSSSTARVQQRPSNAGQSP